MECICHNILLQSTATVCSILHCLCWGSVAQTNRRLERPAGLFAHASAEYCHCEAAVFIFPGCYSLPGMIPQPKRMFISEHLFSFDARIMLLVDD